MIDKNFKCPNEKECVTICDIGYACDGCPYNKEIFNVEKETKIAEKKRINLI